ncbi:methylmalonyl-CoA mutase family protein [Ectobacillus sp. JY-23]|uniref:methylmalonyl-CoA mutase family protein n=1 Tax=Ectobacillus sp. JY-23 TaxID=2933872 RepID=UPI001FF172E0|nr:methylmalonyl-CoA mutase family protein [Ectobacillus sp. JY-23]UOY93925.1 methylmalonyl-CoA mutase family protein [Ectobacillus sp. JY-23]
MNKYTFREFEDVSYDEWKRLAEKALKGKQVESLERKTYEDIVIKPLYTKHNQVFVRPKLLHENKDGIAQELFALTPEEANAAVKRAIAHGQSILHLVVDEATKRGEDSSEDVGKQGIPLSCKQDVESVLHGVDIENHSIFVYAGYHAIPLIGMIGSVYRNTNEMKGIIGADPLGYIAETGYMPLSLRSCYDAMKETVSWSREKAPGLRTIFIRTDAYHHAGANSVQELSVALATGAEYMREGIKRGLNPAHIAQQMMFSLCVDTQLFTEIAKLRAGRILWKKIAEMFGAQGNMHIHVRTSGRTKTKYDPHVNLLRTTTEAFSAITGGADTLHVSVYNEALGNNDENGERWARNIQHILRGESHLTKVLDPAGGSYYIEALTKEIAKRAWRLFCRIEKAGGMSIVLKDGWLHEEIAKVAEQRKTDVLLSYKKVIGTNVYINHNETSKLLQENVRVNRLTALKAYKEGRHAALFLPTCDVEACITAFKNGTTIGEATASWATQGEKIKALPVMRDAEEIERLREATERYKVVHGSLPIAALVRMGEGELPFYIVPLLTACGFSVENQEVQADIMLVYGSEAAHKETVIAYTALVGVKANEYERSIQHPADLLTFLEDFHQMQEVAL